MTWDENKHPRDGKGRFTSGYGESSAKSDNDSKNKNSNLSPAQILYGDSTKKVKNEKEYRNLLLKTLGNSATPALTLYGSVKELAKAVKENGLTKKVIQSGNTAIQKGMEFAIGKYYGGIMHSTANLFAGKDGAGMLDLAHGAKMNDRSYIKDTISLKNFDDPKIASDKSYLKDKLSKQFKDYGFDINKIKGYYFKSDSEPCQRLAQNKDFQEMLKSHKKEILEKGRFSDGFKKYGDFDLLQNNNFHNAIGKADFRNIYQDKLGNLHVKMYDTYDFNKGENNPLIKAGASQMEKGNLKPFFTIHDIIIPKNELDKIWK